MANHEELVKDAGQITETKIREVQVWDTSDQNQLLGGRWRNTMANLERSGSGTEANRGGLVFRAVSLPTYSEDARTPSASGVEFHEAMRSCGASSCIG